MRELQPPGTGDPAGALGELSARWAAAAEQAFASGLTDPTTYTRTLRLVSAVVAALRARGDDAQTLLAAWSERRGLVTAVADGDPALTLDGLHLESVAGAAFAMRHREVAETIAGARRLAALAEHDATVRWAVLEESGPSAGDPFVPYRRLEVDAAAGRAIRVSTRANDEFSAAVHLVEELGFDRSSGALLPPDDTTVAGDLHQFSSAAERERHVAALRERVSLAPNAPGDG